jgi:peptidoglycan/xylan/chitin deacetylase (PgdA/CDA1 family)
MPAPRAILTGTAVALFVVLATAAGVRQLINGPIQLFGDHLRRIDTTEKIVALTFDDGPIPPNTLRMLDLLDRHQIKATFFMMGRNVERWPDVAREVLARGHEVGNHSYSHPRLVFMRPSRVREEIERTDALLRGVGVTGDIYFSPPHGAKLVVLPYVLVKMQKIAIYSYTDPKEWKRPSADVMVERVLLQVRPGAVVGFHDVLGGETLVAVDRVVTTLKAEGYRFEKISNFVERVFPNR